MFGQYNPYNSPFMRQGAAPWMQQQPMMPQQSMAPQQFAGASWLDKLPDDAQDMFRRFMFSRNRPAPGVARMMQGFMPPQAPQAPMTGGIHQGQAPQQPMGGIAQGRAPMPPMTAGMHQGQAPQPPMTGGIAQGRFPGVMG